MSEFPDWLPVPVIAWIEANRDHPEHIAGADLIHQFATDPRAKTLWTELAKRKPRGFAYPAQPAALASLLNDVPADDDARQNLALLLLFKQILNLAIWVLPAKTEANRAMRAEEMRQRAVWLRTEAADTDLIPNGAAGIDWRLVAAGMRAKADVLHQTADALGVYHLVVPYDRENMDGLAKASRISAMTEAMFGNPLYRQSAAIAELLTGETVTFEQVRDLRRKHPARVKFVRKSL